MVGISVAAFHLLLGPACQGSQTNRSKTLLPEGVLHESASTEYPGCQDDHSIKNLSTLTATLTCSKLIICLACGLSSSPERSYHTVTILSRLLNTHCCGLAAAVLR
jgi:hypothetical protein